MSTTRTTADVCKCLLHSLISDAVDVPTAATNKTQSICGRIEMTLSPASIGGMSKITIRERFSFLISCSIVLMARDVMYSDVWVVDASHGRTVNR